MPSSFANIDTYFPVLTEETSAKDQNRALLNYLRILTDQLQYTLKNLGPENLEELRSSIDSLALSMQITAEQMGKLTAAFVIDEEGNIQIGGEDISVEITGTVTVNGTPLNP